MRRVVACAKCNGGWDSWILENPAPQIDHGGVGWASSGVSQEKYNPKGKSGHHDKDRRLLQRSNFSAKDTARILEEYGEQFG